jgi:hypothetical protein
MCGQVDHSSNRVHGALLMLLLAVLTLIAMPVGTIVFAIVVTQMPCGFILHSGENLYTETNSIVVNNYTVVVDNIYKFYNLMAFDHSNCSLERYNGTNYIDGVNALLPIGDIYNIYYNSNSSICYSNNVVRNCSTEHSLSVLLIIFAAISSLFVIFACCGLVDRCDKS